MNKKIIAAFAALALVSAAAFAGDNNATEGMLITPQSFNVNVGLDYNVWGIGVGGGAEYAIGKFNISRVPFTYGAAARAGMYFGSGLDFAVGAFGTLHFCWDSIPFPENVSWLGNFDTYIGLGCQFLPNIWPATISGLSYFFSPTFAVNAEYALYSANIGILLKL